jgi:hypothetical protein
MANNNINRVVEDEKGGESTIFITEKLINDSPTEWNRLSLGRIAIFKPHSATYHPPTAPSVTARLPLQPHRQGGDLSNRRPFERGRVKGVAIGTRKRTAGRRGDETASEEDARRWTILAAAANKINEWTAQVLRKTGQGHAEIIVQRYNSYFNLNIPVKMPTVDFSGLSYFELKNFKNCLKRQQWLLTSCEKDIKLWGSLKIVYLFNPLLNA